MTNRGLLVSPYNRQSIANVIYRPIRNAFLIPDGDKNLFLKLLKINSVLWGGGINAYFPYEKIAGGDIFWRTALSNYKPDNILVPESVPENIRNSISEDYDVFHVYKISDVFESGILRKDRIGLHIFSLFESEKTRLINQTARQTIFFDLTDDEHQDDFRYAVAFGCINNDKTSQINHLYLEADKKYDSYIKLLNISKENVKQASFIQFFTQWLNGDFVSIYDHTILSSDRFVRTIDSACPSRIFNAPLFILVDDSLEGYMLSYNLRYRLRNAPFMIKSNDSEISENDLKIIRSYLDKSEISNYAIFSFRTGSSIPQVLIDLFPNKAQIYSQDDILTILKSEIGLAYKFSEQITLQKYVDFLFKKPNFFDSLDYLDSFVGEIEFSNYKIPYRRALNEKHWSFKMVSPGGIKTILMGNRDENHLLMLPEIDDIVYTLLVKKDIWLRDTAVRKKMSAVATYFDSYWDLDIFTAKELQELFFEFKSGDCDIHNYGDMCKIIHSASPGEKFTGDVIKCMIDTLIKRKFFFRGYLSKCPNCYLAEWKMLDDVRNNIVCNGCGSEILFPDVQKTHWQYKLNQIFKENFDLTVFLTLMYLVGFKHLNLDKILGYNFGFKADLSKNNALVSRLNGKQEMEVDFAIVENGRIIIGECKQNPADFSEEVINNLLEFGKLMECDEIVLSSIGNLSGLRGDLKRKSLSGFPSVQVIDENELSYITAYLNNCLELQRKYHSRHPDQGDLENLNDRRSAFIKQYKSIAKHRMKPNDIIGRYFHL
ncbi:MAG: hypothetical protein NTZ78_14885 [Candidatus Aureabacteria bacterium]|nr:hypothetical protein [Candidatus Auribacterota bacterium]